MNCKVARTTDGEQNRRGLSSSYEIDRGHCYQFRQKVSKMSQCDYATLYVSVRPITSAPNVRTKSLLCMSHPRQVKSNIKRVPQHAVPSSPFTRPLPNTEQPSPLSPSSPSITYNVPQERRSHWWRFSRRDHHSYPLFQTRC